MNHAEDVVFHLDAVCQSVVEATRFKMEKGGPLPVEAEKDLQRAASAFQLACRLLQDAIVHAKLAKGK